MYHDIEIIFARNIKLFLRERTTSYDTIDPQICAINIATFSSIMCGFLIVRCIRENIEVFVM